MTALGQSVQNLEIPLLRRHEPVTNDRWRAIIWVADKPTSRQADTGDRQQTLHSGRWVWQHFFKLMIAKRYVAPLCCVLRSKPLLAHGPTAMRIGQTSAANVYGTPTKAIINGIERDHQSGLVFLA